MHERRFNCHSPRRRFISALQYALQTSAIGPGQHTLIPAGYAADHLGWPAFFLLTIAAALPRTAMLA